MGGPIGPRGAKLNFPGQKGLGLWARPPKAPPLVFWRGDLFGPPGGFGGTRRDPFPTTGGGILWGPPFGDRKFGPPKKGGPPGGLIFLGSAILEGDPFWGGVTRAPFESGPPWWGGQTRGGPETPGGAFGEKIPFSEGGRWKNPRRCWSPLGGRWGGPHKKGGGESAGVKKGGGAVAPPGENRKRGAQISPTGGGGLWAPPWGGGLPHTRGGGKILFFPPPI